MSATNKNADRIAVPLTAPPLPQRPSTRADFEIAIICAHPFEADAVDALFDSYWDDEGSFYGKAPQDTNAYTTGTIGRHNVVLAFMPGIGKATAASVATGLRMSFISIKLALVIGVCGAIPFVANGDEVLLGDVIISEALIQYDLGKRLPDRFVHKDTLLNALGRPNTEIRALSSKLKGVRHGRELHTKLQDYLEVLNQTPELRAKYPGQSYDKLFEANYRHIENGMLCDEYGCEGHLISRRRLEQTIPRPVIHFGLIASGDTAIESGKYRDTISSETNTIAFETEGAGIWDSFPCIVIKGVCDYADGHRAAIWQQYAAATAAACMKAFLGHWVPSLTPSLEQSVNNMSAPESLQEKQKRLLRRLWISKSKYEDQKNRNPHRVPGTCEWFIKHPLFQNWQHAKGSALLWVSADPGCGKSVLVRCLVDEILPSTATRTTCYFFFKDDFEDQKSITSALCCILRQLFNQQPHLLSNQLLNEFELSGEEILTSFHDLWRILVTVTSRVDIGEIVCILDALDECEIKGQSEMALALSMFYNTSSTNSCLKFIVTSRPYASIRQSFRDLENRQPTIHLSGENEEEVEIISREIDTVIRTRIKELGDTINLSIRDERILEEELFAVDHRTYLWVYLVFDVLQNDNAIFTKANLRENIRRLPKTVEEAYDKILCKSRHIDRAKKLLHIIVTAGRALSLQEMAEALVITENHRSHMGFRHDILSPEVLSRNIREVCGLFVVIKDSRIYLLHQTAREFLLQSSSSQHIANRRSPLKWQHSLNPMESNKILSEICIRYLLLADVTQSMSSAESPTKETPYALRDYSAKSWANHLRQAQSTSRQALVSSALELCSMDSQPRSSWFQIYWTTIGSQFPVGFDCLMIASYFGLEHVVALLLQAKHVKFATKDATYQRSALSWASENGHEQVVKLLLQRVPKYQVLLRDWSSKRSTIVNAKDILSRTPLWYAATNGHTEIVEMLINKGANVNSEDNYGQTPLGWAVHNGHMMTIDMLRQNGAKRDVKARHLDMKDSDGRTPLLRAAGAGHEAVVRMLLDKDADLEATDSSGRTPLQRAATEGHGAVAQVLLDKGADPEATGSSGWTPLFRAAIEGHAAVAQVLLDKGANPEATDNEGWTPLHRAAIKGHMTVARVLLEKGANPEATDNKGWTPLHRAAIAGHEDVARILLEKGVNPEATDSAGRKPLHRAAEAGHIALAQVLLEKGANPEATDSSGRTPLQRAATEGHGAVARVLLDKGANPKPRTTKA